MTKLSAAEFAKSFGATEIMALLVAALLTMAAASAQAKQAIKNCAGVSVRSLRVSPKILRDVALNKQQETIETPVAGAKTPEITLIVHGPVLGSMDSAKLDAKLVCARDGFALEAAITRSAEYQGAVAQNVLWFPEITMVLTPRRAELVFRTIWKMRLTDGTVLHLARTPPFPERKYPMTLTKVLHGS